MKRTGFWELLEPGMIKRTDETGQRGKTVPCDKGDPGNFVMGTNPPPEANGYPSTRSRVYEGVQTAKRGGEFVRNMARRALP